jgi:hypothetical protein
VSGFADDTALMDALTDRYHRGTQEDYYAQLGRALAPRAAEIQNYLGNAPNAQRQAPAPAAPADWERPQFDQRWTGMVERDPLSGMYLGKPGTPPAIVEAVNKFAGWQERFGSDPLSAVRPYVEQQLPQVIERHVAQALAAHESQRAAQEILARNSDWMYQADPAGRPSFGVGGQRVLTEQGRRYGQYVQHLESQGIRDPRSVDTLARQLVMSEINAGLAEQYRGTQEPSPQASNSVAASRPQVNPLQAVRPQARATTPGSTEPNQEGMTLHDRLTHAVAAAGFTDADFSSFHQE